MTASTATAALLLALLAPAPAAFPAPVPQDPPSGPAAPAADPAIELARVEAVELASKRIRTLADTAWGQDLKATAAGLYRQLLLYSGSDPHARDRLGWKRRGDTWEQGEAPEALDRAPAGRAQAFETRRARDLAAPAEAHARLAALLDRAGRKEEARAAWEAALRLDPSNAAARSARGDSLVKGKWVPAEVVAYLDLRKRLEEERRSIRAAPSRAKPVAVRTKEEELLGVDLARARSPRFFTRMDGKPADAARVCDVAEGAMDLLDALLGTTATPGENPDRNLILLADGSRYRAAVERMSFDTPQAKADALAQVGTFLPDMTYVGYLVDPAWGLDLSAHKAGEAFLRLRYGAAYEIMWLREAFGVLGAVLMLDSHETFCVQSEDGDVERDQPIRPALWPEVLAAEVGRGKDRPLRGIVDSGILGLSYSDVAKSCTMILWWESTRPGSTARFVDAVAGGKFPNEAAVEVFGAGLDAQDEGWRAWIVAVNAAR